VVVVVVVGGGREEELLRGREERGHRWEDGGGRDRGRTWVAVRGDTT